MEKDEKGKLIKQPDWVKNKRERNFILGIGFKHSLILAYISWGTVFGIIWLALSDKIILNTITWIFWGFSIVIAILSSAMSK